MDFVCGFLVCDFWIKSIEIKCEIIKLFGWEVIGVVVMGMEGRGETEVSLEGMNKF